MTEVQANTAVDLTNCDREPIHRPGAVQPFGCLIAFSSDWLVIHISANVGEFIGRAPREVLGTPAKRFITADALKALRARLQRAHAGDASERLFGLDLFGNGRLHDIAIHTSNGLIVVEIEHSAPDSEIAALGAVRAMVARLRDAASMRDFLAAAVHQVRDLIGFDRVMVYRFLEGGSGEVIAEAKAPATDSYAGLRFPASDIPKQARALYVRNIFRIIADVDAEPAAIVPATTPEGAPLDLSMSVLRAVSPIHLEYLRNMGVAASLSISIVVDGELWGLFACHNFSPRKSSFERRTAAELFGELFSLELADRHRRALLTNQARARVAQDRIMATMASEETPFENLRRNLPSFTELIDADGCMVWADGQYALLGRGLSREEAGSLIRFLNRAGTSRAFATSELGAHHEPAMSYADRVAGILAIPVSRAARDYVILFRREIAQSVAWAGNPDKPATLGPNGARLQPRKSFAAWRDVVRGTSAAWSDSDLAVAESLRSTLLELVLRSIDEKRELKKRARETQDLLISELNHRVRNILTLIRGIIRQSGEGTVSVAQFSEILDGRIHALARAHDQLTEQDFTAAPLYGLLANEFAAYSRAGEEAFALEGPDVALSAGAYSCLALVMHELVTNAVKYGALSAAGGSIRVAWSLDPASGALVIDWRERGGPPVQPPRRRGFGSSLIERAVPFELGGEADVEFAVAGVTARFSVPEHHLAKASDVAPPAGVAAPVGAHIDPRTTPLLLVEDNVIIAMDAELMLASAGFEDIEVANDIAAAHAILEKRTIGAAVLDINLGRETSIPIAEALQARGIPFIFASGYGDPLALPDEMRAVPVVTKPYTGDKIVAALSTFA